MSTTGSNGNIGKYQVEAYQLWEEQVNARGGLLGRPVKMTILDDASDPTTGQKLYEKLISEDKVDLVLGPYASSVTMSSSTTTEKYKYPMLAAGASASDIWKRGFRYVFGVYSIAETYFNGVIELAVKQGLKTMAILHEDTVFPAATASGTAAQAKAKGMQVVLQERYPTKVTDVSSLLTKVKDLNPDILVGGSYEPDSMLITRQAKELDVNPRMMAFSVGAADAGLRAVPRRRRRLRLRPLHVGALPEHPGQQGVPGQLPEEVEPGAGLPRGDRLRRGADPGGGREEGQLPRPGEAARRPGYPGHHDDPARQVQGGRDRGCRPGTSRC